MPDLKSILDDTLLFRAAKGRGIDMFANALAPGTQIVQGVPKPTPLPFDLPIVESDDAETILPNNPIWTWDHSGADPSEFTNGRVVKRHGKNYLSHPHTVFEKFKFSSITVTTKAGKTITLPINDEFVAMVFHTNDGEVRDFGGYWVLPHVIDTSLLTVLAYELRDGSLAPMSKAQIDELGTNLMPTRESILHKIFPGQTIEVQLAPARFLVFVGLTTCRERNDWEPGELLGAARFFPHTMLVSNVDLVEAKSSLFLTRPPKAPLHDPEMQEDIAAILFADSNEPALTPLPLWDNIFTHYELNPAETLVGLPLKFVDRERGDRIISGGIQRASRKVPMLDVNNFRTRADDFYETTSSFRKVEGQGEFDNIHLAPAMTFQHTTKPFTRGGLRVPGGTQTFEDIRMAPFCVHDCLHMHTRWGDIGLPVPKSNRGFSGDSPYSVVTAPQVPSDQSVFVTVMHNSGWAYEAVARGNLGKGRLQCFMHHGAGYAQDLWPTLDVPVKMQVLVKAVEKHAETLVEPFTLPERGNFGASPFARLYQRLRFGGIQLPSNPSISQFMERLKIVDLDRCRS